MYACAFQRTSTEIRSSDQRYRLIFHSGRRNWHRRDGRRYKTPQACEVAILILWSENGLGEQSDIFLHSNSNALPCFPYDYKVSDALAYPLVFLTETQECREKYVITVNLSANLMLAINGKTQQIEPTSLRKTLSTGVRVLFMSKSWTNRSRLRRVNKRQEKIVQTYT